MPYENRIITLLSARNKDVSWNTYVSEDNILDENENDKQQDSQKTADITYKIKYSIPILTWLLSMYFSFDPLLFILHFLLELSNVYFAFSFSFIFDYSRLFPSTLVRCQKHKQKHKQTNNVKCMNLFFDCVLLY